MIYKLRFNHMMIHRQASRALCNDDNLNGILNYLNHYYAVCFNDKSRVVDGVVSL